MFRLYLEVSKTLKGCLYFVTLQDREDENCSSLQCQLLRRYLSYMRKNDFLGVDLDAKCCVNFKVSTHSRAHARSK